MKITSEIFQVGGGPLTSPEDAAIYLIKFGEECALVDAGCGNGMERLLANIRKIADPAAIKYLLITHCHFDHTGGAAEIKKRIGLETVAHNWMRLPGIRGQPRTAAAGTVPCEAFPGGQKTRGKKGGNTSRRQEDRGRSRSRTLAGVGGFCG